MVPRLMASREEEKRRRREEREAAEQAAAAAAARKKRLGLVTAAVLGLAAVAAIVVGVITLTGGDDKGGGDKPNGGGTGASVPIPERKISDLADAAKAAGCVLKDPPNEGSTHVQEKVTYKSNPPTSGNHNPEPPADGIYTPGNQPAIENLVHTLEHGRIDYQYKPGTPKRRIDQLETLFNEKEGYHQLVFQNPTGMPYAVAATTWDHLIGCETFNDKVFDALRAFRDRYTDKGPEFVP